MGDSAGGSQKNMGTGQFLATFGFYLHSSAFYDFG